MTQKTEKEIESPYGMPYDLIIARMKFANPEKFFKVYDEMCEEKQMSLDLSQFPNNFNFLQRYFA